MLPPTSLWKLKFSKRREASVRFATIEKYDKVTSSLKAIEMFVFKPI